MQLINNLLDEINKLYPDKDNLIILKSKLSSIISDYDIQTKQVEENNKDDNKNKYIELYIFTKKLEGLSENTLYNIQKPVDNININDLRLYLSKFSNQKSSTITTKIWVLKSFFSWLKEENIINNNPTNLLKIPKNKSKMPLYLNSEELEKLRDSCKTLRERVLVEILFASGLRLSELHSLNINSINQKTKSAIVMDKGKKEREIYFSTKSLYYLKKYLKSRKDDCEALIVTYRSDIRRLSMRGIQREIKIIAKRTDIKQNVYCHLYRKSLGMYALQQGCDIATISAILGHSDISTTQKFYAQYTSETKREKYNKFFIQ